MCTANQGRPRDEACAASQRMGGTVVRLLIAIASSSSLLQQDIHLFHSLVQSFASYSCPRGLLQHPRIGLFVSGHLTCGIAIASEPDCRRSCPAAPFHPNKPPQSARTGTTSGPSRPEQNAQRAAYPAPQCSAPLPPAQPSIAPLRLRFDCNQTSRLSHTRFHVLTTAPPPMSS